MDEKLKKIIIIVFSIFIFIILFLFIASGCSKKNYEPADLESMIVRNTKNYYKNHEDELPGLNIVKTIDLQELVSKNIIDDLNKILDKNTTCSGTVKIENNNNYYMYAPNINCKNEKETYKTKVLKDILLENVVTNGNGLYNLYSNYYFRGDNVDNYIIFDGILWRITKINIDGTIRLIETGKRDGIVWDDRYNEEESSNTGINDYIRNGINSRIKDTLETIYSNEQMISNDAKGYIKPTKLCIGKRSKTDTSIDGSIECNTVLENQYLGLLQANEYLIASLDSNCQSLDSQACINYNYLSTLSNSWTITANSDNSKSVYKIAGTVSTTNASSISMARLVINISENTAVTGEGTEENPYVVIGLSKDIKELNKK